MRAAGIAIVVSVTGIALVTYVIPESLQRIMRRPKGGKR
jgi:hypothetical protein